jgi:ribose transport system substrate-binding protein
MNRKTIFSVIVLVLALSMVAGTITAQDDGLSLDGKTIGVIVIGTDHNWDRMAFQGVIDGVEELGGEVIAVNAERDDQKHVAGLENLIAQEPDAIVNILGNQEVIEPVYAQIREAGIPLFTVDSASIHSINNVTSDNYAIGSKLALKLAEDIGGEGNIAVFNGFYSIHVCSIRYDMLVYVLEKEYPNINIIQPELQDVIPNTIEDARQKIQDLLLQYPEGELDAVWSCWDVPSIGVVNALEEAGRDEVKVYGIDGDPTVLEMLTDPDSLMTATMAQQPYLIGQTSAMNIAHYFADQPVSRNTYIEPFLVTHENAEEMMAILLGE